MVPDNEEKVFVNIDDISQKYFILNYGDHAYFRTFLDTESAEFLSQSLYKIDDSLTRALVWRSIMAMVKAMKLKSPILFDYIFLNLMHETQTVIIKYILMIAHGQVTAYVPDEHQFHILDKMFEFCYKFIQSTKSKEIVQVLVSTLLDFCYTRDQIDLALKWLDAQCVLDHADRKIAYADLTRNNKFQIVIKVFDEKSFDQKFKDDLLARVIGTENDDQVKNLKLTCESLKTTLHDKQNIWKRLSDPKAKDSMYE